ncbi:HAMP domain-containing histidine kinase [Amycolatopsis acidiphila]|uniref:histidine kinase n=1 Tax=Amycolatopsis acidiphila TaxID=715473 RepID=A0A557ZTU8_9PSEU|nr:HAMP domain-containing sensor histidine kinase [Amycolatopsis acidiphila]TVT15420.1 HAMP domain-containing histidine kinase [Amycolatopsis acidiphila]UIJ59510.1 HAMP domain-containing histidine kinase [Amycolatopsis acidiphila]GHG80330.1 two-component sensor histidine kinase [Amycolatopsis acidiphila]
MRTVSLRRRVTLTALAVLAVVLAGVLLTLQLLFSVATNRTVNAILADRVQLAQQLAAQKVGAAELIQRVDARSVRAQLVLPDGETFGSLNLRAANEPGVRRVRLDSGPLKGARLTLEADAGLLSGARATLFRLSALAGVVALLVTAVALVFGVRFALSPLDAMTRLTRSIARGGRGRRLSPSQPDTELGRTAQAFDEMLDALEGSEQRTKRFVADAAHELRTPVAGLQAVADAMLQQRPDAPPEERERLQLLLGREARRAGKLVDDLLDLARIDAGIELQRQPADVRAMAATQVDRARLQHPDRTVELTGDEVVAEVDPDRVAQIVANLVDNACQATPPGGRVSVTVARSGDAVEIVVADTGPGVSPADQERIFDRLVRLDDARDRRAGGSGLGLPIARGFARAHGGDLSYLPGSPGARFRLVLPLTSALPRR